ARDLHLRLDALAVEAFQDDFFDSLSDFRVVSVTGDVHQTGIKAMIGVAASEQAHGAPLIEIYGAPHDADQIVRSRLKQLVPWVSLQNVQDGFAVVSGRVQAEMLDHALDLAPQDRNVACAAVVDAGGPKAEKAMLTDHTAPRVEILQADVVEVL